MRISLSDTIGTISGFLKLLFVIVACPFLNFSHKLCISITNLKSSKEVVLASVLVIAEKP